MTLPNKIIDPLGDEVKEQSIYEEIKSMTPNQEPVERWDEQLHELIGGQLSPHDYIELEEFITHQKALSRAEVLEEVRGKIGGLPVTTITYSKATGEWSANACIDRSDTLAVIDKLEEKK